jgi:hypothetical protein
VQAEIRAELSLAASLPGEPPPPQALSDATKIAATSKEVVLNPVVYGISHTPGRKARRRGNVPAFGSGGTI